MERERERDGVREGRRRVDMEREERGETKWVERKYIELRDSKTNSGDIGEGTLSLISVSAADSGDVIVIIMVDIGTQTNGWISGHFKQ